MLPYCAMVNSGTFIDDGYRIFTAAKVFFKALFNAARIRGQHPQRSICMQIQLHYIYMHSNSRVQYYVHGEISRK